MTALTEVKQHTFEVSYNKALQTLPKSQAEKDSMSELQEKGVITVIPAKGGVRLYLAEEAPTGAESTLRKIFE